MNRNLPVPVGETMSPYIKRRKRREMRSLTRFLALLLAVVLLVALVFCLGKLGVFSFLGAWFGAPAETTGDTTGNTTPEETTTGLYDFDYEKLSEGAFAIVPCDLSARAAGLLFDNRTDYVPEAIVPRALSAVAGDKVTVLVVNTHPYEAYSAEDSYEYTDGSYVNSEDREKTVAAVADAFIASLAKSGIQAVYVDVPTTSGRNSYTAAYEALTSALAEYPDVMYIVDIQRDILLDEDGNMQRPVTYGTDGAMAQMRLVVGTDADGAAYEDWESGAAASLFLAERMTAAYPSLMMPTEISTSRLNQHLPATVFTVEIGACGNRLEEAVRTARAFGEVLAAAIQK